MAMAGYLLLFFALAGLSNAREVSLVLVKDAVNQVSIYSSTCSVLAYWAASPCKILAKQNPSITNRVPCASTAHRLATTSGRAAAAELISGSCIRKGGRGATLWRIVSTAAKRHLERPRYGRAQRLSEASSPTMKQSMESSIIGT